MKTFKHDAKVGGPSLEEFLKFIDNRKLFTLTPRQEIMAESYINFRRVVSPARRIGKTFVLSLLKKYFNEYYPYSGDSEL